MGNDFPTKCSKCNSAWKWNKDFDPPEGSTRAKEGKLGWWEVDGKPHYKEQCDAVIGAKAPENKNNFSFDGDILKMNVAKSPQLTDGANLVHQAIETAEEMIGTLYQDNQPQGNVRGQIRNALTGHILLGTQAIILKEELRNINEKISEIQKSLKQTTK